MVNHSTKTLTAGTLFLALALSTFASPVNFPSMNIQETKHCDTCEAVFTRAEQTLKDPKLIANSLSIIDDLVCNRLPKEAQAKCNETMSEKVPEFLAGIASHWLDPTRDCEELGFCHKDNLLTSNLKCDICSKIIEFLSDDVLQSEKVQDYATEQLDMACGVLPETYSGLCEGAVNASVPEILSYIASFLESNGCSYMGFCNKEIVEIPELWDEFKSFMTEFKKDYETANEFLQRFAIFKDNFKYVKEHSSNTLKLELNKYADMTCIEFGIHKKQGCILEAFEHEANKCVPFVAENLTLVPNDIDWRKKGAVTPVKDQQRCGSCWSFSATGSMEAAYFLKKGKLLSFSEQELVDCSNSFGNMGCNGGLMDNAFEYALENGMCSETEEPYMARDEKCVACQKQAEFTECLDVAPDNEAELMKAVSQQPVSVAIEADHQVFQFYKSGIINDESCGTALDHGVLVVGYGEDNGQKYWLVKNSWGVEWGEEGYVRISRDDSKEGPGICGIASQPSFIEA